MNIYKPLVSDGYELCQPVDGDDFETIKDQVNGEPRGQTWSPIPMRRILQDEGRRLEPSDSPWLGWHAPIFTRNAVDRIGNKLCKYGELLPLECPEGELFVFNTTRVVDAVDIERSSVSRFSDGRIMMIYRYEFDHRVVEGLDVFKVPNKRTSPTFFSERMVEVWRQSGLVGLDFKLVWSNSTVM